MGAASEPQFECDSNRSMGSGTYPMISMVPSSHAYPLHHGPTQQTRKALMQAPQIINFKHNEGAPRTGGNTGRSNAPRPTTRMEATFHPGPRVKEPDSRGETPASTKDEP